MRDLFCDDSYPTVHEPQSCDMRQIRRMTSALYLEIWNQFALVRVYSTQTIYRVAQKVSHYHESSLNRTKTRH